MTHVGDGWYRCSIICTASAPTNYTRIHMTTGDGLTSYTGDGTSGIYIYRAQLELGSQPTSYVRTFDNQSLWNAKRSNVAVTNLVKNGNYVTTDGWTTANATISANNNTAIVTGNGAAATPQVMSSSIRASTEGQSGYIYIYGWVRVTNADCTSIRVALYGTTSGESIIKTINSPVRDCWYLFTGVVSIYSIVGNKHFYVRHNYADAATANGKVMEVQEVLAIDLTAIFGPGCEPTVTQCDEMFQSWFDGNAILDLPGYYKSENVSANNLVTNGNFANGTTGWSVTAGSLSATNNILSLTGDGTSTTVSTIHDTVTPNVSGAKVYVRAKVRVTNAVAASARLYINKQSGGSEVQVAIQTSPTNGQQYILSGIATIVANTENIRTYVRHIYADAATSSGKVMEVQEVIAIYVSALPASLQALSDTALKAVLDSWAWFDGNTVQEYKSSVVAAQFGSTTGADANDPTIIGNGITHDGGDYTRADVPLPVTMSEDWAIFVAGLFNGTVGTVVSIGDTTVDNMFQRIQQVASRTVKIHSQNGATELLSDACIVSDTIPSVLLLYSCGGKLYLKNLSSGTIVSMNNTNPVGAPKLTIGERSRATLNAKIDAMTGYSTVFYNRMPSDAEVKQEYTYLKKLWKGRGVNVA